MGTDGSGQAGSGSGSVADATMGSELTGVSKADILQAIGPGRRQFINEFLQLGI